MLGGLNGRVEFIALLDIYDYLNLLLKVLVALFNISTLDVQNYHLSNIQVFFLFLCGI